MRCPICGKGEEVSHLECVLQAQKRAEELYNRRLPYKEAEVAQKRYEEAEAEIDRLRKDLEDVIDALEALEGTQEAKTEGTLSMEHLRSYLGVD